VSQMFLHIGKAKGDKASPLVKAFVAAAAKLTDEEYNSYDGIIKPMNAMADAFAKKPNPFRQ
jgi:hypothetical protein